MEPKSLSLFLVICSILLASASMEAFATLDGRKVSSLSGWQAVSNLTDPEVIEIAEFAVKEHNKRAHPILRFVSVVKGETQIVNGKNYRLIIIARDGLTVTADESNYQVVVWDKPWTKERRLISFRRLLNHVHVEE